jgi:cyclopropane fatty-acyl-phospholipid synthase-like methyltransferase
MTGMTGDNPHDYDTAMLDMLQIIWGEGYLSPGGPQAVREIMQGLDLAGKRVLDIGCGIGGLDQVLVSLGAAL